MQLCFECELLPHWVNIGGWLQSVLLCGNERSDLSKRRSLGPIVPFLRWQELVKVPALLASLDVQNPDSRSKISKIQTFVLGMGSIIYLSKKSCLRFVKHKEPLASSFGFAPVTAEAQARNLLFAFSPMPFPMISMIFKMIQWTFLKVLRRKTPKISQAHGVMLLSPLM